MSMGEKLVDSLIAAYEEEEMQEKKMCVIESEGRYLMECIPSPSGSPPQYPYAWLLITSAGVRPRASVFSKTRARKICEALLLDRKTCIIELEPERTIETVEAELAKTKKELKQAYENLTAVQARCTELVENARSRDNRTLIAVRSCGYVDAMGYYWLKGWLENHK